MKCDIYLQLHSIFLILLTVLDALDCIGLTIHNPQEVVHHSHCTCCLDHHLEVPSLSFCGKMAALKLVCQSCRDPDLVNSVGAVWWWCYCERAHSGMCHSLWLYAYAHNFIFAAFLLHPVWHPVNLSTHRHMCTFKGRESCKVWKYKRNVCLCPTADFISKQQTAGLKK